MNRKFTGILSGLGLVTVEGAEDQTEETQQPASKPAGKRTSAAPKTEDAGTEEDASVAATPRVTISINPNEENEMHEKIHGLIVKMNREGVDFFELWDNVLEMDGGITPSNIRNAYKFLRKSSNGQITPEIVEETCEFYCTELQRLFDQDAKKKEAEKQQLTDNMAAEKTQLTQEISDLSQQIADLNTKRAEAETALSQLSSKYTPQIQQISRKVTVGKKYVDSAVSEMKSFLQTALPIIQSVQ